MIGDVYVYIGIIGKIYIQQRHKWTCRLLQLSLPWLLQKMIDSSVRLSYDQKRQEKKK